MSNWTTADIPDQHGRVALVTGSNAGLGFEIAQELARAGATVILGCRNRAKAEAAADALRAVSATGEVEVLPLDLADLASVAAAAASFRATARPLDLLINNAGLMAVDKSHTVDGFEMQFGVNHLGHFALTSDLLPALLDAHGARVVNMSSMGHRGGKMHFDDLMHDKRYDRWTPYLQSKLANLLFTSELQRRLARAGAGLVALAAHPGFAHTDLGSEGGGITNSMTRLFAPLVAQPAARGAEPALRAATDPTAQGGEYYGPRWKARGPAVPEIPSNRARRSDDAARLWTISERLTGRTMLRL